MGKKAPKDDGGWRDFTYRAGVESSAEHRRGVQELDTWKRHLADLATRARAALDVRQGLDIVRHPAGLGIRQRIRSLTA